MAKNWVRKVAPGPKKGICPGLVGRGALVRPKRATVPGHPQVDFTIEYIVIYRILGSTEPFSAPTGVPDRS